MNLNLQTDVSLADLTTLKIGGRARFFAAAESEEQIVKAVDFAAKNDLKVFVLGGGSNVLVADRGFDGLVLQIALKGVSISFETNQIARVRAGAGEDWEAFCGFCVENNLQGVECLSGIPGCVGGTPVQNVGAYGQEVSETIVSVSCFDRQHRRLIELSNLECRFAYRTSIFNTIEKNRYIVTAVTYALRRNGEPKIVYRDLQNYFAGQTPTLPEARRAVLEIRRAKSMVIDKNDPNSVSAGSFFKNPIVSKKEFEIIKENACSNGFENVPFYQTDAENVKIPAAWLIEKSGIEKGFAFGRVGISANHSLAIINRGGASAGDVISLKNFIQTKVKESFNIELKPEPVFVGFDEDFQI